MGFMINGEGWLEGCRKLVSPNVDRRPEPFDETCPNLLVIHNISLPPGQFGGGYIEAFFLNELSVSEHAYFSEIADLKVSAHVLIDRNGSLTQFVSFNDRAWHAGASVYGDKTRCNDFSIGIELEGTDIDPYTDAQYTELASLTRLLIDRYPAISVPKIVGHCDIAPDRKTDPSMSFDWHRYLASL